VTVKKRKKTEDIACNQVHCALRASDEAEIAVQNTENEYRPRPKSVRKLVDKA